MEPDGAVTVMEVFQHRIIYTNHIHQLQGIAFFVGINGVRQGDLPLQLFLTAKVH